MKCKWKSCKEYGYKDNVFMPTNREDNKHLERYNNIPRIDMDKTNYKYCPYCGKEIELIK